MLHQGVLATREAGSAEPSKAGTQAEKEVAQLPQLQVAVGSALAPERVVGGSAAALGGARAAGNDR